MKKVIFLIAFMALGQGAFGCDEDCLKEKAMKEHNVDFAGYLSSDFCETTKVDFLLRDLENLQSYRSEQLPTGHKGGMQNIRKMLLKRKDWLAECDRYLRLTDQGRIFSNAQTTERIFTAIDQVAAELKALIHNGSRKITVTQGLGIVEQEFDQMFTMLHQHKTQLQLRGQLVIR